MAVKQKAQPAEAVATTASTEVAEATEKKPRKLRTARTWQWTPERQKALHRVLTSTEGTIRTAGSVAQALMSHPEFEGIVLSSLEVASVVKAFIAGLEAEGKAVPTCLKLDSARRKLDLSLFG